MALSEYARKRKFDQTPEPKPEIPEEHSGTRGGFFCVQRHDASHLHYDFRLEVEGVLVSWAIPKGPSLDPARKPLAMKVEDHPLDYGNFEGNIPKGNYGGGSVMLWDRGTYEVIGDPDATGQLARGDFKFRLEGVKLKGAFAIVLMKNRGKGNEWLLIKKPDEFAVKGYDIDQFAWSVSTKRTQEQIAQDEEAVSPESLTGARKSPFPKDIEPMLATAVTKPPVGDQWVYEIKWDGVRAICTVRDGKVQMESRRGNRCEQQYPELQNLADHVDAKVAVLDGEICVLDEDRRSRFGLIQPRITNSRDIDRLSEETPATLFLFDVLYADGYDVRKSPLEERRRLLKRLVQPAERIRVSEVFETDGEQMFAAAREMGLEGILAKDRHSLYESKRSRSWQKLKVLTEQEFVIGGFTKGEREHFGALILGLFENEKLRHVGQVGTGFDQKLMKAIADRLKPLITTTNPFVNKPRIKDATWVKPELLCQVRYLEITSEGNLRAPVFVGLRDDKPATEVVREVPQDPEPAPTSALDLKGKELIADVDGRRLKFTNLDKIFYPKDGWKKRDIIGFYDRVSPWLLPHLKDRPLSMKRYPNGIEDQYFFQKDAAKGFPDWMQCQIIREGHPPKNNHYVLANDRATLLYLANLGCIDQNPWLSRVGTLENPDWMLIDIDPVEADYDLIVEAALIVRTVLDDLGLKGYPKTTGGDGMHIYVPLEPIYTYAHVRSFCEIVAQLTLDKQPGLFTTPRSVDKRKKGRVYFDYLQIGTGKTIAAPYVLRAHEKAPVSTPLAWDEVKRGIRPTDFRIDNAIERFERVGDLFAPVLTEKQNIEEALQIAGQSG